MASQHELSDGVDGFEEERSHLGVVVDVVGVADAHEYHKGRQTRDERASHARFQFYQPQVKLVFFVTITY